MTTAATSLRALERHRAHLEPTQGARFRIRLVNVLPSLGIIIVDDECVWHPYLDTSTGVTAPYLIDPASTGYAPHVVRYAERLASPPLKLSHLGP